MNSFCKHLPDQLDYSDFNSIDDLIEAAYNIFLDELFNMKVLYNSKPIFFFVHPINDGYKQGFYHCTTTKSNSNSRRIHDIYRLERVNWIKPIIENVDCREPRCSGVYNWCERTTGRHYLYMADFRYVIILEEKKNVFNFITSFYVNNESQHRKLISKFHQNSN